MQSTMCPSDSDPSAMTIEQSLHLNCRTSLATAVVHVQRSLSWGGLAAAQAVHNRRRHC